MAKTNSNNDDITKKLETLADRLEKTNTSLGAKISEIITSQASFTTNLTNLTANLTTNQQQISQLTAKIASLEQKLNNVNSNTNSIKQSVETTVNNTSTKIDSQTQQIGQTLQKQSSIEKNLSEVSESYNSYTAQLKKETNIFLVLVGVAIAFLTYNYYHMEAKVNSLNDQLDAIKQQLIEIKKPNNKTESEIKTTAGDKEKSKGKQ